MFNVKFQVYLNAYISRRIVFARNVESCFIVSGNERTYTFRAFYAVYPVMTSLKYLQNKTAD